MTLRFKLRKFEIIVDQLYRIYVQISILGAARIKRAFFFLSVMLTLTWMQVDILLPWMEKNIQLHMI